MANEKPFGGKVFVVGGDFRQTLPVVARGTRTDIVESCIKSSRLWNHFTQLTLTTNMRSEGQDDHNWLLYVETGNLPTDPGILEDSTIQIPQEMVAKEDLIETIFSNHIQLMSVDDSPKRVIVAPTNAGT